MSISLIPRGVYPSITAIPPAALRERGIRLVLADLDNTLVPYRELEPPAKLIAWKEELETVGIALFLLSNSRKPDRPRLFAQKLGIPFLGRAGKPMGCTPEQTVMVGDQIFTDILGASRAGVVPLLVEPIRLAGNPGRYLRYWGETPMRLLGRRRPFV